MKWTVTGLLGALALVLFMLPEAAYAQAAPAAAAQHADDFGTRADEDDVRLELTAGSALAYGNARNLAINVGGNFQLHLGQHALLAQIGWVYGKSSQRDMDTHVYADWTDTANNLTWQLRYDFFLDRDDSLFIAHHGRRDPFAQLLPRLGVQAGYRRNLVNEENHRFWVEIGYDLTYDRFSEKLDIGNPDPSIDRTLHSARLFIGYDNHINEVLTYQTGLEALMTIDRPEHWRFQWINQLRSKIADWLQISLNLTGRFDSQPPGQAQAWQQQVNPAVQMLDVLVTLNLVGSFDMYTEQQQAEEEEEAQEAACACPPVPACAAGTDGYADAPVSDSTASDSTAGDSTGGDSAAGSADAPASDGSPAEATDSIGVDEPTDTSGGESAPADATVPEPPSTETAPGTDGEAAPSEGGPV